MQSVDVKCSFIKLHGEYQISRTSTRNVIYPHLREDSNSSHITAYHIVAIASRIKKRKADELLDQSEKQYQL